MLSRLVPYLLIAGLLVGVYAWNVGVSYRAVTDEAVVKYPAHEDIFSPGRGIALFPPEYQIRDGKLYLRIQAERDLLLFMGVEQTEWEVARIRAFRARHPELEGYWPDPEGEDGGVRWVR
jgi:hypothetical protein